MDVSAEMERFLHGEHESTRDSGEHGLELFMTPQDLQNYLRIGRTKCYELLAQNAIPSYSVGRLRRVKKSDVDRWLESQRYASWE